MFNVVLDTNIILSSISSNSPYKTILNQLFLHRFNLFITTEILLEYEEKLTDIFSKNVAEIFLSALLLNRSVFKIETFFELNLIHSDKDDNKFTNCAFAANAHFLVSNDKHFNSLKTFEFPKINLLNIDEFIEILALNSLA
jgi:uncharacterized protein